MNTEFIREGNRTLYCFSIFYAQDEWGRILPLLHTYMMSNPDIHQYMFFLSYERGEHIRLIFSSYTVHGAILQEAVHQALKKIVDNHPSCELVPTFYGKELWAHHPANAVVRNAFEISRYQVYCIPYSAFLNLTSLLIIRLLADDCSEEGRTSVALYLYVQLCRSSRFVSLHDYLHSLHVPDCTENVEEEMELISFYWESNPVDEFLSDMTTFYLWQKEREFIYSILGIADGFTVLAYNIREQLGLMDKSYLYALSLLKTWSMYTIK